MEARYLGDSNRLAAIGDVVMVQGNVRGIVIGVDGTFVKVLAIGTNVNTGDTFVIKPTFIHDYSARDCHYMERQMLNL